MAKHPEVGTLEYKCDVAAGALQLLLEAVHRDDPKREILVRIGDLMRDVEVVTKGVRRSSERTSARPLEWQDVVVDRGDGSTDHAGWEADTGFGHWYEIKMYFGSDSYGWEVVYDYETVADCDDPDQAKKAAQTDFEKRVLAVVSGSGDAS